MLAKSSEHKTWLQMNRGLPHIMISTSKFSLFCVESLLSCFALPGSKNCRSVVPRFIDRLHNLLSEHEDVFLFSGDLVIVDGFNGLCSSLNNAACLVGVYTRLWIRAVNL